LEFVSARFEVIFERNRVRILPHDEAFAFWKAWARGEKK
jgi:hypothetical protein